MKRELDLVKEFHEKFGSPVLDSPQLIPRERFEFRFNIMREEVEEYLEGNESKDLSNIAKELADILFTVYGSILEHGLQDKMEEIFEEVNKSNMSKDLSPKGVKAIKGENYFKADIDSILNTK